MTNPDNIVRVRARNGGRASVYEANAWAQAYTPGILDGVGVVQSTTAGMNVLVGGSNTKPDVIIAENPLGYKIALDIIGQQSIAITTPSILSRITCIVAYTDDLALSSEEDNVTGSPASCGLIVVNGDPSANPTAPDDATIRSAITADGATGSQASYAVVASITVASSTTAITNMLIDNNQSVAERKLGKAIVDAAYPIGSIYMSASLSTAKQVETALGGTWVAWGAGRVPVGVDSSDADFDAVEKTGGDKDLQKHSHGLPVGNIAYYVGDSSGQANFTGGNSCQFWSQDVATNEAGNGSSGNLQPYITCYMYKRTA